MGFLIFCFLMLSGICSHPRFAGDQVENYETATRIQENIKLFQTQMEELQREFDEKSKDVLIEEPASPPVKEDTEDQDLDWSLWSVFVPAVFIVIEICIQDLDWKLLCKTIDEEDDDDDEVEQACQRSFTQLVSFPDRTVLESFYKMHIRSTMQDITRMCEFVEGFTDILLVGCRSLCQKDYGIFLEDCTGVGSMFEKWGSKREVTFDLLVPLLPPEGYVFKPEEMHPEFPPEKRGYRRIAVHSGCMCNRTEILADVLCLIHGKDKFHLGEKPEDSLETCLCTDAYLDTEKVLKWMRALLLASWEQISHKYDFKVTFPSAALCILKLAYRTGRHIYINIIPAVRCRDTDVCFVTLNFGIHQPRVYWLESFALLEHQFLKGIARSLPEDSCHIKCLQILTYLNERHSPSKASVLTSYHIKTALMHLLLVHSPEKWQSQWITQRLRDVVRYFSCCLDEKRLYHFMTGNRSLMTKFDIPSDFQDTEPVNLFRAFVLDHAAYRNALAEFQEMVMSVNALVPECAV
ncbi:inositol 1,4,5-trisphosphate receptor-interacting protein-like 1 [Protopterus annectens]|uniref:inositol 1,4,5-trisphosphate receptor-interacting protein-like 1 n=1 Tax=Protopterus annectens TaxID=7888 RepID=UPI001CFB4961|nr:inositol 1,4,5-trisphosphate receptor-interacting protein-like 1 [Protopterus annectens]XP_043940146.1 inositol 1,4,5-trisphosphate receptor-interacting protein-like 1 [Protopterus annectens]